MQEAARVSTQSDVDVLTMIEHIWLIYPHNWDNDQAMPEKWVKDAQKIKQGADDGFAEKDAVSRSLLNCMRSLGPRKQ